MTFYTPSELQKILKLDKNIIYYLLETEEIPAVKIDRFYRTSEEALKLWAQENIGQQILMLGRQ